MRRICSVAAREAGYSVALDDDLEAAGWGRGGLGAGLGNCRFVPQEPHVLFSPSLVSFALDHGGGQKQFHLLLEKFLRG